MGRFWSCATERPAKTAVVRAIASFILNDLLACVEWDARVGYWLLSAEDVVELGEEKRMGGARCLESQVQVPVTAAGAIGQ